MKPMLNLARNSDARVDEFRSCPAFRFRAVFVAAALAILCPSLVRAADSAIISNVDLASMHQSNGNVLNDSDGKPWGGFGGGPNMNNLFNGRFGTDYVYLPNMGQDGGGYLIIDFTSKLATGYYITEIKIGSGGTNPYSLYWSPNGTTWNNVADQEGGTAETAGSTLVYAIGEIATHVKLVFHRTPRWNYSTPQISEIQVWGIDPAEMACTHRAWSDWEVVRPATCTSRALEMHYCLQCNEEETREAGMPLGHDYVTHLDKGGKCNRFGRGSITCTRCDWVADFPEPRDLYAFGGEAELYKVQLVDMTASSENHAAWGTGLAKAHDNNWTSGYWSNVGREDAWIEFAFGTTIDITAVEFSVHNHAQTIKFYSRDGETETFLSEVEIVPDESEDAPATQRMTVHFTETPVSALRVRIFDEIGIEVWSSMCVILYEIHPYGTVKGAGLLLYDPTTLMIFR